MGSFDQIALLLLLAIPLAGALLLMFAPVGRGGRASKDVWLFSVFVAAISLALSLVIFARYDYAQGGFQFTRTFEWLDAPLNIDFSLGIDGITAPLVLLNGIVLLGGVLISQNIRRRSRDFFVLLLALGTGVYGVFAVRDLFFCSSSTNWRSCPCTFSSGSGAAAPTLGRSCGPKNTAQ